MIANKILPLLSNVKQTGKNSWMASCPLHKDTNPSLCITDTGDTVLMKCFSCHAPAPDILEPLGLSASDLYPENPDQDYTPQRRQYFPARDVLNALGSDAVLVTILLDKLIREGRLEYDELVRLETSSRRFERAAEYAN